MQLSGLDLRYALTTVLLRAGVPIAIPELQRALEREGFTCWGRPIKEIADALRWEIVRRVADLRLGASVGT